MPAALPPDWPAPRRRPGDAKCLLPRHGLTTQSEGRGALGEAPPTLRGPVTHLDEAIDVDFAVLVLVQC